MWTPKIYYATEIWNHSIRYAFPIFFLPLFSYEILVTRISSGIIRNHKVNCYFCQNFKRNKKGSCYVRHV